MEGYLKAHQRLALVILVRRDARRLAPDDGQLHMLDLQAHEQKVDAPDNDVLEVVLALRVLKLNVQTVLDADVHLDGAVALGRHAVRVHPQVLLAHHVRHAPRHRHAQEVAQLDIDAVVRFVLLLDIAEVEVERLRVLQVTGRRQLLAQRQELEVAAAVRVYFFLMMKERRGKSANHTSLIRNRPLYIYNFIKIHNENFIFSP